MVPSVNPNDPNRLIRSGAFPGAFVVKLKPDGSAPVFSLSLNNGNGVGRGRGIRLDKKGHVFVTGMVRGTSLITRQAVFKTNPALMDPFESAFVTELTTSGDLVYSTYLGGIDPCPACSAPSVQEAGGIAVNGHGGAYVTGQTQSPNFPLWPPLPPKQPFEGVTDAFAAKIVGGK
jgi:hypothetical protein